VREGAVVTRAADLRQRLDAREERVAVERDEAASAHRCELVLDLARQGRGGAFHPELPDREDGRLARDEVERQRERDEPEADEQGASARQSVRDREAA
jgi:hypothetical protein